MRQLRLMKTTFSRRVNEVTYISEYFFSSKMRKTFKARMQAKKPPLFYYHYYGVQTWECFDSLKMRKTRRTRMKTKEPPFLAASQSASICWMIRFMKNGRIARMSNMFIMLIQNCQQTGTGKQFNQSTRRAPHADSAILLQCCHFFVVFFQMAAMYAVEVHPVWQR